MANTVKLKRSAVAAKVPTTSDLQLGELAINTYDGKVYLKKDNGTASIVEVGASSGAAVGGGSDQVFFVNSLTVTTSYSIPSGKAAMTVGPVTVNSGVTVTVPSGSRWVVL